MAENYPNATYTTYTIQRGILEDPGIMPMAVAGPSPQRAEIVQLHAAIEYEYIAWIASRLGAPCEMPDPYVVQQQNSNLRYLGAQVSANIPMQTSNQGHLFVQSGLYLYLRQNTQGITGLLPLGKLPWEALSTDANDIPSTYFLNNLISTPAQPQSPPLDLGVLNRPLQGQPNPP